jgi:tetratricopeptide (TPR) repeat protein
MVRPELLSPTVALLHSWAQMEARQGRWAQARSLLLQALHLQPCNVMLLQSVAMLEGKVHNWGAAREFFLRATQASPRDPVPWQAWAVMEGQRGHLSRMRSLFQQALQLDPSNVPSMQAWAVLEAKHLSSPGRASGKRGLEEEEEEEGGGEEEAQLEECYHTEQRCRTLFQQCAKLAPDNVQVWQVRLRQLTVILVA